MENFELLIKNIKKHSFSITIKRQYILKEIFFSLKPLNAKEIKKQIKEKYKLDISLPTLYKGLQFFEDLNIVGSIFISSKKTTYYYLKGIKSQNFLICLKCGTITIFNDIHMNNQIKEISLKNNFFLLSQRVMLYGICEECDK